MNPLILKSLSAVVGAEVVTLGPDGKVVASSLEAESNSVVDAARRVVRVRSSDGGAARVAEEDCGFPCLIAFRQVEGRAGMVVVLVADASPLASATRAVVRTMLVAAALSVIVLVLVSQVVVKRVTAPLDQLVGFVRTRGSELSADRAPVGRNEVGALAEAFNGMLDRLEESRSALVRSEKLGLAGLFAARVAHDIRNPLSSIRMQTQLLHARCAHDREDRETLASILRDVDQVESVVRDLMELSNPGDLRCASTSLNDVVREALHQMAHQLAYRKIVVEESLDRALAPIPLDGARLKQALLNIIVNGSEAMHSGGLMTVATGSGDDSSQWVRICDDGVGVDPAVLDRAFDAFVSTKPDGVGLGLVNVKAVVEAHGGRISLQRREPRGTCAVISLPGTSRG
ncbi:MAG TPA: ATP-binding protein [Vicinamibacterales bacterium]